MLGILAITGFAAAKLAAIILGSIVGLIFLLFIILEFLTRRYELMGLYYFVNGIRIIFYAAVVFGVVWLAIMGIGALI